MSDGLEWEWLKLPYMSEAERARRMEEIEKRVKAMPLEACDHCGKPDQCVVTRDPRNPSSDPSLWCSECFVARCGQPKGEAP